jgi:SHS2 domain-containing protein
MTPREWPRANDAARMTPREHRLLPHTADAGLEARGPDLASVFEEAALALAGLTADIAPEALLELEAGALPVLRSVRLVGADLSELAFTWLNELVGRVDLDGALAAVEVASVEAAGAYRPAWSHEPTASPETGGSPGTGRSPDTGGSPGTDRSPETATAPPSDAGWTLAARVATLPFDGVHVRRRADVKSATYHELAVVPDPKGGWRLTAYLDL